MGPSGPAWRSQLCLPWPPSVSVSQALELLVLPGNPGPSSLRDVPLQLCQATCSLLERALLTLWFLGHGLWASGRGGGCSLLALGGSLALGCQSGWKILLCVGSYLLTYWLHWVLVAALGLFIAARGLSSCSTRA